MLLISIKVLNGVRRDMTTVLSFKLYDSYIIRNVSIRGATFSDDIKSDTLGEVASSVQEILYVDIFKMNLIYINS